jgi:molecular chaperone GrpE
MFNLFKRRNAMSHPESHADQADALHTQPDEALAPAEQPDLDDLQAQIANLQAEIKDVQARANADMYNFQKRVERETDNAKKYALEKFAGSLLDVVDNLERAIAAAGDQESPLVEGIRLTQKSMLTVLEKHGVQLIDPAGEAFNADVHQAVGIAPDVAANVVGVVLQKGYSLNGRLLRPAMVMVGQ